MTPLLFVFLLIFNISHACFVCLPRNCWLNQKPSGLDSGTSGTARDRIGIENLLNSQKVWPNDQIDSEEKNPEKKNIYIHMYIKKAFKKNNLAFGLVFH